MLTDLFWENIIHVVSSKNDSKEDKALLFFFFFFIVNCNKKVDLIWKF